MNKSNTFSGNDVPKLTKILFPWSGIFRDACYSLIGTFLMQYAITAGVLSTDAAQFKAQYGVITVAMIIALVWDGINDPIMGFLLEKCHFKAGKFRPWIEIGAIGNAFAVLAMFVTPMIFTGLRGWGYVVFMIIMYVLWDVFFTMNDIGYWSMLPALTSDPEQRAKLTTTTAIAASIGTFIMNIAMFVLPGTFSGSTMQIYAYAGLTVATLFLLTQTIVFLKCKEKERDSEQEEISENSSILDLFRVVAKNKQLLFAVIGLLLYYFASMIITGIGQNYFYMVFGYGGNKGGIIASIIAVVYIMATIFAQAFYPMLSKKMSREKIITISGVIILVAYIMFFFIGFPVFGELPLAYNTPTESILWAFGGTMSLYYICAFLFFGGSGIYYLAILVMFQDAIDYNEYEYGERKESICFAWRALNVKLASGLNRALQYITYALSGTMFFINKVSDEEGNYNALIQDKSLSASQIETLTANRDSAIELSRVTIDKNQLTVFGIIIISVILVCFIVSYCVLHFGYNIDEEKEKMIVEELERRHKQNEEKKANLQTETNNEIKQEG